MQNMQSQLTLVYVAVSNNINNKSKLERPILTKCILYTINLSRAVP